MTDDRLSRRLELLADRASGGLDAASEAELETLLAGHPTGQDDSMDLAAAAVDLAFLESGETPEEPMPGHLRARILAGAPGSAGWASGSSGSRDAVGSSVRVAPSGSVWTRWLPWSFALASLLLVVWMWNRPPGVPQGAEVTPPAHVDPTSAELWAQLLDRDPAALRLEWTATEDPAADGAAGGVLWSDLEQNGFMTFRGLAANDPSVMQYQLWIFDANRDDRYPVDGGVFDVPPGATEVVVPIRAKLGVDQPVLFAVTAERPGGVVVSSRERIVLVAQPATETGG